MSPERRDELALRAVGVLVVGSLGVALAGLTWRLTGWDDGRQAVAVADSLAPLTGAAGAAGGADAEVARIVGLAPFGGGGVQGGLPTSTLGLVLKGVLSAYPPEASTVLIALGEGPATLYGVGQFPVANGVIEAIGVDHVVLNVGGTRERLDFPATVAAPSQAQAAAPGGGVTVTPAQAAPPANPQAAAALALSSPIATAAAAAAQATRTSIDAGATPNLAAVAGAAGVTASAAGYRIGPNPSAELRRFGLQPGDVIESLNGQAVGSTASDQQLFESARAAGQARVVVVRQGRRITLNLPLR